MKNLLIKTIDQLDALREIYPWPLEKPIASVSASSWSCWPMPEIMLKANLTEATRLVVELGSWLGCSARFILDHAPNATLICVDHWQGSSEHHEPKEYSDLLPTLYEDFLSLCWEQRSRIIPVRETTLKGMHVIADLGLSPDMVYIDAAHDYESVKADLETACRLFPDSAIVGDDYLGAAIWEGEKAVGVDYGVRRAVNHFIYDRGWGVQCAERGWQILPKTSRTSEIK